MNTEGFIQSFWNWSVARSLLLYEMSPQPIIHLYRESRNNQRKMSVFRHSVAKQASSKKSQWPAKENHRTLNSKQACRGRQPCKTLLRLVLWRLGHTGHSHLSLACWSLPEPVVWGHFGAFLPLTWVTDTDLWQWASVGGICKAAEWNGDVETNKKGQKKKKTPSQQALEKIKEVVFLHTHTAAA